MKFPKKLYVTRHEDGNIVYFSSHIDVDEAHDGLEDQQDRAIAVYKLDSTGKSKRKTKFIKEG